MPELPEVEVVRRGLDEHVVGRTIAAVQVFHPRAIRRHVAGETDFVDGLLGATVSSTQRRGKYMWLALDDTDALVVHLGMSGQVLIVPAAEVRSRHERVSFTFADGDPAVSFVDQRTFGGLLLDRGGAELPSMITHIARDPFDPEFDDDAFVAAVRRRKVGLKRALLDQTLVSGIGNIYADEALWLAKLHWAKPTETMRRAQILDVLAAARSVMGSALAQGGTSFDSLYVNVNGQSGYFDRSLEAYGRRDQPCSRCGTPMRRDSFMNRSSYSCPVCQPRPRRARF